ncbi:ATP-grasp domain-containing protein [Paenibacillus woosongensis]|uniref:ATP-grasp domain-containing protein n=1 Tax=Paenibacillus woosongensis TaxID=307580 RepID=A0AA95I2F3_9BACL|nr:ATP-grasp domain-containing protein [Paenibacillus woosongensis]WHX48540.1 ATP-grasp domain-containing protein [Paenibacillus woosongensis]
MRTKVLMVGLNKAFLHSLECADNRYEVFILEEQDLYEANPQAYKSKILQEVRFGEYQQSEQVVDQVFQWFQEIGFDVIVPGMEYAVQGTYKAAARLGLRTPGAKAIAAFTNKYRLRQACREIGVPQPEFAKVSSEVDVARFYHDRPIIIKPVNRRASVGVIKIEKSEDIESAWNESINASEKNRLVQRSLFWEYIVEDYLEGVEYSVESLVLDGQVIFNNITLKETVGGRYFAETGHILPAPLDFEKKSSLLEANERLLSGLEVSFGLFHSEWKMTTGGPMLIECAARAPGDKIPELIHEVYHFNLYEAFLQVLMGRHPNVASLCDGYAGIRYFRPNPGRLIDLKGVDILKSDESIISYQINVSLGEIITNFNSSWDRVGYFMIKSNQMIDLQEKLDQIESNIIFHVGE